MKHNTGNDREFRVHAHEFVITHDDLGMVAGDTPDWRGYVNKAKLSPAVINWLEQRNIKYFVRSSFFDINLCMEGDSNAALFKLTWGM